MQHLDDRRQTTKIANKLTFSSKLKKKLLHIALSLNLLLTRPDINLPKAKYKKKEIDNPELKGKREDNKLLWQNLKTQPWVKDNTLVALKKLNPGTIDNHIDFDIQGRISTYKNYFDQEKYGDIIRNKEIFWHGTKFTMKTFISILKHGIINNKSARHLWIKTSKETIWYNWDNQISISYSPVLNPGINWFSSFQFYSQKKWNVSFAIAPDLNHIVSGKQNHRGEKSEFFDEVYYTRWDIPPQDIKWIMIEEKRLDETYQWKSLREILKSEYTNLKIYNKNGFGIEI